MPWFNCLIALWFLFPFYSLPRHHHWSSFAEHTPPPFHFLTKHFFASKILFQYVWNQNFFGPKTLFWNQNPDFFWIQNFFGPKFRPNIFWKRKILDKNWKYKDLTFDMYDCYFYGKCLWSFRAIQQLLDRGNIIFRFTKAPND